MVALDISAAFDTICLSKLIDRPRDEFGINSVALSWIESYISGRSQFVKIGRHFSTLSHLDFGDPQGSVLGPLLFSVYVSPVGDVIRTTGLKHHQYADDTQVYVEVRSGKNCAVGTKKIEECTLAVQVWFQLNDLQLNLPKSEVISLGTVAQRRASTGAAPLVLRAVSCLSWKKINSPGAYIDANLSFDAQVNTVCRTSNYHISALRRIRNNLPMDVAKTVACSIAGSRLDYCNALLYGISDKNIQRLQLVQNNLERIVLTLFIYFILFIYVHL